MQLLLAHLVAWRVILRTPAAVRMALVGVSSSSLGSEASSLLDVGVKWRSVDRADADCRRPLDVKLQAAVERQLQVIVERQTSGDR